jgi:hypothetical protein
MSKGSQGGVERVEIHALRHLSRHRSTNTAAAIGNWNELVMLGHVLLIST